LCFFERPGGFVEMIIPQFVQKENSVTVMAGTHQDYAADFAI
jgi:hypothetical protein